MWTRFKPRIKKAKPVLPPGLRVYAVGDIHGRLDLLEKVTARIDADLSQSPSAEAVEIYLGDYIDRGPASREVVDRLIWRGLERKAVFLKGNHETYVPRFLDDPAVLAEWRTYGGLATLMSYGLKPSINASEAEQAELARALRSAIPNSHQRFLGDLKTAVSYGDFLFVHAGIRPRVPLAQQREEDLLWIRDDFLHCQDEFEKVVVHGHTPVRDPDIRPNRINIDTGAYATGKLTCIRIEQDSVEVL